jgi:ABC-type multidrug transport system ATPase subunit/pSer/pThr/pTyr-binding forkhead associated (FHA) protein
MEETTQLFNTNPQKIELRAAGRTWQATAGRVWTIGRAPQADVHLDNPKVSRDQAVLQCTPAGWVLVNHSRNGMFIDGQRVERLDVRHPVTVLLGSLSSGEHLQISPISAAPVGPPRPRSGRPVRGEETTIARSPTAVHSIDQIAVTIGRAPENVLVLEDLLVSRRHAVARRSGSQWELVDLGSANGTYINGARVNRAVIGPDDIVGIGHRLLHLAGDRLVEYVDNGDISYAATGLNVVADKGRVLLSDVSFVLPERSFLAVVGPSGAGKSTLLGALTGFRPATTGSVQYDERDLYDNYAELRHRIGFVPQDDILHTPLTVRRALNYAAQLRFPQDVTAQERRQRIEEVLAELGLTAQADQRIESLSGGQRKRTSVALELLTKPSLLFLDEPTSGLDPGYEKSVMKTLRELADDGRSVVVVTHNVAHLNLCDRLLVLAPGGRLAYFGPPQHALSYFRCDDFADLFMLLEQDTATDWTGRFNASPLRGAFTGPNPVVRPPASAPPAPPNKPVGQQSGLAQFAILCRRYLAVIAADRQYTIFLLALPLLLSLFTHAAPGHVGLNVSEAAAKRSTQPVQLLTLLIIGGALMGCAAAIREIVKERAIYRREHGIGLSRSAYLASKIVVLTVLTTLQGLVLGMVGVLGLPPPEEALVLHSSSIEVAVAVVTVTVVSMLIGLLISTLIANADRGMPLLVLVVMAQLILCGGLFPVPNALEQVSWLLPSRWGYSMGASTVGLNYLRSQIGGQEDPLWGHSSVHWLVALGASAALAVVVTGLITLSLSRQDPHRKARK